MCVWLGVSRFCFWKCQFCSWNLLTKKGYSAHKKWGKVHILLGFCPPSNLKRHLKLSYWPVLHFSQSTLLSISIVGSAQYDSLEIVTQSFLLGLLECGFQTHSTAAELICCVASTVANFAQVGSFLQWFWKNWRMFSILNSSPLMPAARARYLIHYIFVFQTLHWDRCILTANALELK